MSIDTARPNFRIYDRTGGGVTEDIYAEDLEDAIRQGREWIEDGCWEAGTHERRLRCEVGPIIYSTGRIRIEYLDAQDCVIATHDTDDDDTQEEHNAWGVWLNDPAVEHPGEPAGAWVSVNLATHTPDGYIPVIDEAATAEADREDCSGTLASADAPECDGDPGTEEDNADEADASGHVWFQDGGDYGSGHGGLKWWCVCARCGMIRETDTGATDPDNGTRVTATSYEDATDESRQTMRSHRTGWTSAQAEQWVRSHDDLDALDRDDLVTVYRTIVGEPVVDEDDNCTLWSELCSHVGHAE